MSTPSALKGKDFEALLMESAKREQKLGRLHMVRYGVQGVTFGGKTILVPSLPDFDGVLAFPPGRQFNIEAKCCASASFPLHDDKFKSRQYSHMKTRNEFGALCFLVIHFAERRLIKETQPGMTVAIPVDPTMRFWQKYEAGEARMLSREDARDMGKLVPWKIPKGCRKALPDLLSFLDPQGTLRAISKTEPVLL